MPRLFDKERVTFDSLVELPVIDFDNIHLHDVIYFSIDNYNPTCCIDHFDTCFWEFQNNFECVGLGTYLCHFRNMTDDARVRLQPLLEKVSGQGRSAVNSSAGDTQRNECEMSISCRW